MTGVVIKIRLFSYYNVQKSHGKSYGLNRIDELSIRCVISKKRPCMLFIQSLFNDFSFNPLFKPFIMLLHHTNEGRTFCQFFQLPGTHIGTRRAQAT